MNNYHLFLIRSDNVTQIAAHLLAGIIALVFIAALTLSQGTALRMEAETPQAAAVVIPAGTAILAAGR